MKLLIVSFFLTISLFATSFQSRYDVDISMFGKIGYIDFSVQEDSNNYEAKVEAYTTGTVATLTSNRKEIFISSGKIINGKYIPNKFVKTKTTDRQTRIQTYTFNHDTQEIKLIENKTKLVNSTRFDAMKFKIVNEEKTEKSTKTKTLKKYNTNDVLTAYLNARKACNSQSKEYNLLAVGAKNDKNDIRLSYLEGQDKTSAIASFSNDTKDVYNLNVNPSDKEDKVVDILIAFDNDGHMKEAYLGDIFWVGEVRASRVYHKLTSR